MKTAGKPASRATRAESASKHVGTVIRSGPFRSARNRSAFVTSHLPGLQWNTGIERRIVDPRPLDAVMPLKCVDRFAVAKGDTDFVQAAQQGRAAPRIDRERNDPSIRTRDA